MNETSQPQRFQAEGNDSSVRTMPTQATGMEPKLQPKRLEVRLNTLLQHIDQLLAANASFTGDLSDNIDIVHSLLGYSDDVFVRTMHLPGQAGRGAAVVFVPGLVDMQILDGVVIKNLLDPIWAAFWDDRGARADWPAQWSAGDWMRHALPAATVMTLNEPEKVASHVLNGLTALFVQGVSEAIVVETIGGPKRAVEEPSAELVVRGPREGFNERLRDNLALLRRRGRDHNLVVKFLALGVRSRTQVAVCHVNDLADPDIVAEVFDRLSHIHVDSIQDSGEVEEFLKDSSWSPFPLVQSTERPDRTFSALVSGRVVVLVDGSPFALMLPTTFSMLMTAAEDYYLAWPFSTLLRVIRWIAAPSALLLPALYVALTSFHQGLLPVQLALAIAASRSGVPFPAFLEALAMEFTIEILREAGVRLPRPVGQAISIVGGLVIGQAAVQARLVSQLMVVVVAFTALATFAVPSFNMAFSLRVLRFGFIILASVLGLFGVVLGVIVLGIHAVTIKSLGVPFMSGLAPFVPAVQTDVVFTAPVTMDQARPAFLGVRDTTVSRLQRDEGW